MYTQRHPKLLFCLHLSSSWKWRLCLSQSQIGLNLRQHLHRDNALHEGDKVVGVLDEPHEHGVEWLSQSESPGKFRRLGERDVVVFTNAIGTQNEILEETIKLLDVLLFGHVLDER